MDPPRVGIPGVALVRAVIRLEYNVGQAQEKIRQAGLPDFLAQRLAYGE